MNQYIIFDNIIYTYMAQSQVRVDVAGDNITINNIATPINIDVLLAQFRALCAAAGAPIQDDISFELLNQNINRADSIKDGTNIPTLDGLKLFTDATWTLQDLKGVIGGVKSHCIDNNLIQRFTFTRTKASGNDESRNWGLDTDNFRIGYDAGLGLDTLFPDVNYQSILIETFGKYIDPSTGGRDARLPFPIKQELYLSPALFQKFGYSGDARCELRATNVGQDEYNYDMTLAGSVIKNTLKKRANDPNIRTYFGGNVSKNAFLGDRTKTKQTDKSLKHQLIVGKGLGDKLQVIILWIRSQLRLPTGIATCDEVVALLCIILQLTFFLTSTSRDDKNVKIDEVLFYNPGGQNPRAARERYNKEYGIVLKSYDDMVALITLLRDNKSIAVIASGGGTEVLNIPDVFYTAMIENLKTIRVSIEVNHNVENFKPGDNVSKIYGEMSNLKQLTARQIFKLNKSKTICQFVRTAKTYTCDDRIVYYPFDKPNLKQNDTDISRRTFYDLFKQYHPQGGGNAQSGGMLGMEKMVKKYKMGISLQNISDDAKNNGDPYYMVSMDPEIRIIIEPNIPSYKESNFVYIDPIFSWIKPGDPIGTDVEGEPIDESLTYKILQNCRPDGRFDANAALRIELYKLYSQSTSSWDDITFWEVLNESMEVFVYDPRYDTPRLTELISNFNRDMYIFENVTDPMAMTTLGSETPPQLPTDGARDTDRTDQELRTTPRATGQVQEAVIPKNGDDLTGAMDTTTSGSESPGSESGLDGGSTRRRKYRNTKRSKKYITRRKKTAKQSSRTRRSTKRRRNKKRRNITRKN